MLNRMNNRGVSVDDREINPMLQVESMKSMENTKGIDGPEPEAHT